MILVIDNYDSFVYNLVRYVEKLGHACIVKRNDAITLTEIKDLKPTAIIISPGPCSPKEAGISTPIIEHFGSKTPILGVCLGHQAIGEAYGGKTIKAKEPIHGKASIIKHNGTGLFDTLPPSIKVGRYHSLITDIANNPNIEILATNEHDEIMAMQHTRHPVFGVQFHPESVLTPQGLDIIRNFITYATNWHAEHAKEESQNKD